MSVETSIVRVFQEETWLTVYRSVAVRESQHYYSLTLKERWGTDAEH